MQIHIKTPPESNPPQIGEMIAELEKIGPYNYWKSLAWKKINETIVNSFTKSKSLITIFLKKRRLSIKREYIRLIVGLMIGIFILTIVRLLTLTGWYALLLIPIIYFIILPHLVLIMNTSHFAGLYTVLIQKLGNLECEATRTHGELNMYIQDLRSNITADNTHQSIDIHETETIRELIPKIQNRILELKKQYTAMEVLIRSNFGIFDNNQKVLDLTDIIKENNDKYILFLITDFTSTIESWICIHSSELSQLNQKLKDTRATVEDMNQEHIFDLQIQRLDKYISSI